MNMVRLPLLGLTVLGMAAAGAGLLPHALDLFGILSCALAVFMPLDRRRRPPAADADYLAALREVDALTPGSRPIAPPIRAPERRAKEVREKRRRLDLMRLAPPEAVAIGALPGWTRIKHRPPPPAPMRRPPPDRPAPTSLPGGPGRLARR